MSGAAMSGASMPMGSLVLNERTLATPGVPEKAIEHVLKHAQGEKGFLFFAVNSGPPSNGVVAFYARQYPWNGFGHVLMYAGDLGTDISVFPRSYNESG